MNQLQTHRHKVGDVVYQRPNGRGVVLELVGKAFPCLLVKFESRSTPTTIPDNYDYSLKKRSVQEHEITRCWRCKLELDRAKAIRCDNCRWSICYSCGSCREHCG